MGGTTKRTLDEMTRLRAENKELKRENEKLRNALSPFACLGMGEIRVGDFNRARRALVPAVPNLEDTS